MNRNDASNPEGARWTLRVDVADVQVLAQRYARLGLRILRQSRDRALVVLPCGVTLVLARRAAPRRICAA
jgi:hypothetical protein